MVCVRVVPSGHTAIYGNHFDLRFINQFQIFGFSSQRNHVIFSEHLTFTSVIAEAGLRGTAQVTYGHGIRTLQRSERY